MTSELHKVSLSGGYNRVSGVDTQLPCYLGAKTRVRFTGTYRGEFSEISEISELSDLVSLVRFVSKIFSEFSKVEGSNLRFKVLGAVSLREK